jgi:hypothetical protein
MVYYPFLANICGEPCWEGWMVQKILKQDVVFGDYETIIFVSVDLSQPEYQKHPLHIIVCGHIAQEFYLQEFLEQCCTSLKIQPSCDSIVISSSFELTPS